MISLIDLQSKCHDTAKEKGFWTQSTNIPEKLALVHSEISEALEEWREGRTHLEWSSEGKPTGMDTELADAVIRILDLAGYLNIDIQKMVELKMEYNAKRPYLHGGKRA